MKTKDGKRKEKRKIHKQTKKLQDLKCELKFQCKFSISIGIIVGMMAGIPESGVDIRNWKHVQMDEKGWSTEELDMFDEYDGNEILYDLKESDTVMDQMFYEK